MAQQKASGTVDHNLAAVKEQIVQFRLRNQPLRIPSVPNTPLTTRQEIEYNNKARRAIVDHLRYVQQVIKEAEVEKDLLEFLIIDLKQMMQQLIDIIDERKKQIREDVHLLHQYQDEEEKLIRVNQQNQQEPEA